MQQQEIETVAYGEGRESENAQFGEDPCSVELRKAGMCRFDDV